MDAQIKAEGLDAKTSHLDFFGVAVKAAETLTFVNGMRILARKARASIHCPFVPSKKTSAALLLHWRCHSSVLPFASADWPTRVCSKQRQLWCWHS